MPYDPDRPAYWPDHSPSQCPYRGGPTACPVCTRYQHVPPRTTWDEAAEAGGLLWGVAKFAFFAAFVVAAFGGCAVNIH